MAPNPESTKQQLIAAAETLFAERGIEGVSLREIKDRRILLKLSGEALMGEADYGIEANAFALHSRIAAQPELGVLPNLGYAVTANLTVPVWDWGGLRSRVRQTQIKARAAKVTLTQTQRALLAALYGRYNEALVAKSAVESAQRVADLAAESLRLTNLRYGAGESTALEVVDAQNTLVQARNAFDDQSARYRVALADLQTLTGNF